MIRRMILGCVHALGYDLVPMRVRTAGQSLVLKPLDPLGVEVLADPAFQASCREVYDLTLLDTARLANLWQLCRLTDPASHIVEIGTYRGGSALHLSNCAPDRRLFVFDSFRGFQSLDSELDHAFSDDMFRDASQAAVEELFSRRKRNACVVSGYFPASAAGLHLEPVGFVHLDVDTYDSTRGALDYLRTRLGPRSLVVADDYHRTAEGVDKAIHEFVAEQRDWAVFPLFPSQALLVSRRWFEQAA